MSSFRHFPAGPSFGLPQGAWAVVSLCCLMACDDNSEPDRTCSDPSCLDTSPDVPERPDVAEDPTTDPPLDTLPDEGSEPPPLVCEPESTQCATLFSVEVCDAAGSAWGDPIPCANRQRCVSGVCEDVERCTPGPLACVGETEEEICLEDGLTRARRSCVVGELCLDGRCQPPPCSPSSKEYLGCEFWAADLPNHPDAQPLPLYITLSNGSGRDVGVTLINHATRVSFREVVRAGRLQGFSLRDANITPGTRSQAIWQITTDAPVTAHQFNPRSNTRQVFSNDASLLLPVGTFGVEYLALAWPTQTFGGDVTTARGSITVVAPASGATVEIVSPVPIQDPDNASEVLAANETHTLTLAPASVVSLQTLAEDGADLSGLWLRASEPVAVFSSHACAFVPDPVMYCDHVEQQLVPVNAWATTYVAPRFAPRGDEPSVWRVVASRDATRLTTVPEIDGLHDQIINRGAVLEVETAVDFVLSATHPVAMAQFMVGSEHPAPPATACDRGLPETCSIPSDPACSSGATAIGDPAMLLAVGNHQMRSAYQVLTPEDYRQDWWTLVFPTDTTLTLDDAPLDTSRAERIGDTDWHRLHLPIPDGVHRVAGSAPFGLYAYGYDCNVSYAYPGGLDVTDTPRD